MFPFSTMHYNKEYLVVMEILNLVFSLLYSTSTPPSVLQIPVFCWNSFFPVAFYFFCLQFWLCCIYHHKSSGVKKNLHDVKIFSIKWWCDIYVFFCMLTRHWYTQFLFLNLMKDNGASVFVIILVLPYTARTGVYNVFLEARTEKVEFCKVLLRCL